MCENCTMQDKNLSDITKIININELETKYLYESFQGLNLNSRTFNKLHLSGCKLMDSVFVNCTFTNCTLQASSLEKVKFLGCEFINCQIKYSVVDEACFQGCQFTNNAWQNTQTIELEVNFSELDEQTAMIVCSHDETITSISKA